MTRRQERLEIFEDLDSPAGISNEDGGFNHKVILYFNNKDDALIFEDKFRKLFNFEPRKI